MAEKQKRQKKPAPNRAEMSIWQRLTLGVRVGLLKAAVMVGVVFVLLFAFALIFPDIPLPV